MVINSVQTENIDFNVFNFLTTQIPRTYSVPGNFHTDIYNNTDRYSNTDRYNNTERYHNTDGYNNNNESPYIDHTNPSYNPYHNTQTSHAWN